MCHQAQSYRTIIAKRRFTTLAPSLLKLATVISGITLALLLPSAFAVESTNSCIDDAEQGKIIVGGFPAEHPINAELTQQLVPFTDQSLESLLQCSADNRVSGVLYVWSPHMPYSVSGLMELNRLTKKLGIYVIPLLDPYADLGLALQIARNQHLRPEALRKLSSRVLLSRGMTLHFPSMTLYSDGKIVGPMVPGYSRLAHNYRLIRKYFH